MIEDGSFSINDNILNINSFKILDGLQRTFRLKMLYDTVELLKEELRRGDSRITQLTRLELSKRFKDRLESLNSSTSILSIILEFYKKNNGDDDFLDKLFLRKQWFEIWTNLSPDDEVNKMLILNAGHKPVKTKHQLELLFRNIIPILNKIDFPDFKLIREKDVSSNKYTKDRKVGEFHFSHLITSLLSFGESKPLTSNIDLIQKSQSDYFTEDLFDSILNLDFLKNFIRTLLDLDIAIHTKYGEAGTRWLGRETSLVGIFAATGRYMSERKISPANAIACIRTKIIANPQSLELGEFENQRNKLDLAKINFGNVNKNAIYNGVFDILAGKSEYLNWSEYFKTNVK